MNMQEPTSETGLNSTVDTLSDEALLEMLTFLRDAVPQEYILGPDHVSEFLESELIKVVRDRRAWERDPSDPSYWMPLHAVMILGRSSTERAGLAISEALEMVVQTQPEFTGYFDGSWPALLRNKPDSILPAFEKILATRHENEYGRLVSASVLAAAAQRRSPSALEEQLRNIATLASDSTETMIFRQHMALILMDLPRAEHRGVVESVADIKTEHGTMFAMADVESAYDKMIDDPEWERFDNPWKFYSQESIAARSEQWADELDDEFPINAAETYVRETPKIGRNDPCSCGSGKKFKKCCMAA